MDRALEIGRVLARRSAARGGAGALGAARYFPARGGRRRAVEPKRAEGTSGTRAGAGAGSSTGGGAEGARDGERSSGGAIAQVARRYGAGGRAGARGGRGRGRRVRTGR